MSSQAAAPRLQIRLPLSQQPWRICLPLGESQSPEPPRSAIVRAAAGNGATASMAPTVQAATDNASNVKAAFAEAGLTEDAIGCILTQYPTYLR